MRGLRIGREAWILGVLLLLFVAATAYYAQRGFEEERESQPTTYSAGPNGLGALHRLVSREGFKAERFERPLTELDDRTGLLVIAEPVQRELGMEETKALWRWVERGGALLVIVAAGIFGEDNEELPSGKVTYTRTEANPTDVSPRDSDSPYLRDVGRIRVEGGLRLRPKNAANQRALIEDSNGACAVAWKRGAGHVILATNELCADNRRLDSADNAILFVNVAEAHARGSGRAVLFDEYHQGFGAEVAERSLWDMLGTPVRSAAWYALVVFLILVYNANRRFGTAKQLLIPSYRPATEYIASMGSLYRRAGAADIAIEALYKTFIRDLAQRIDAPPEAGRERIASLAAARFGWNAEQLTALMTRCETAAGGARISDGEMLNLARQIDEYRRKADLVRSA